MTLYYQCEKCGTEMCGTFGDDVTCEKCGTVYATDWDCTSDGDIMCWITRERPHTAPVAPQDAPNAPGGPTTPETS